MDFLCVGFQKCGTTTLDAILRQHSGIVLPDIMKETHMFYWRREPDKRLLFLKKKYFGNVNDESRIYGSIEPNFSEHAKDIYECFGNQVKLIFIMRNPVNHLYSYFKMAHRVGDFSIVQPKSQADPQLDAAFDYFVRKYLVRNSFSYARGYIDRGKYVNIIRSFLDYYPVEQMRFYLFENFINDPAEVIGDILVFLGAGTEKLDYEKSENKGDRIARNLFCMHINRRVWCIENYLRSSSLLCKEIYKIHNALKEIILTHTERESTIKMSDNARRICEKYYRNSKDELKEFLNFDLDNIWYK